MPVASVLSPEECASLREVAKGQHQDAIPPDREVRLRALSLTHRILGGPASRMRAGRGLPAASNHFAGLAHMQVPSPHTARLIKRRFPVLA
jgi:hypothetical protein